MEAGSAHSNCFTRQSPGTFQLFLVVRILAGREARLHHYWREAARFVRRLTPVIQTVARFAR